MPDETQDHHRPRYGSIAMAFYGAEKLEKVW
jgi:hypothetical protein